MTTLTKYPLITDENLENLESIYSQLHNLKLRLEKVVHPDIIEQIEGMHNVMKQAFETTWDSEERKFDDNYDKLSAISDEYKLSTVWSISEISAEQLNDDFSKTPVKSISYNGGFTHTFKGEGKILTALGMWIIADKLIKKSKDEDHIFIEFFTETSPGHYDVFTGS